MYVEVFKIYAGGLLTLQSSHGLQACKSGVKLSSNEKRQKRLEAIDRLRDGLMRGNWLW